MKLSVQVLFIIFISISTLTPQTTRKHSGQTGKPVSDLTPVIYVPGIMASPLYDDVDDNNRLELAEKAWVGIKLPSLWLTANGIDPAGSFNIKVSPLRGDSANTLRKEFTSMPMDLFKGFFDNLESIGYKLDDYDNDHYEGENLFCFTYDWRRFNTHNAQLLSYFIDSVLSWTGAENVNLAAHSMGGIVSKTCIKLFDKSRIKNIVFIGTPHLGAPEMMTVMLKGKLFDWLNYIIEEPVVRSLARNLPSCYELIPSAGYFNTGITNGISTDADVYSECFQLPGGSYADYPQMINYLEDYTSSLGENLNDALIDSSESFKRYIDTVDFGEIDVFNIVGCNQWTIGNNRVVVGSPPLNWISIIESRNLNGDYTVPLRSAELINSTIAEHTYYISGIEHCDMPASLPVKEILSGIFGDPPVTYFPQYVSPPPSYRTPANEIEDEILEAGSFSLSQNYPNPFNPSTQIDFSLSNDSEIKLKIFDILGREIAVLVNGHLNAGSYSILFNAPGLTSGVYIYKIEVMSSGGKVFNSVRKMTLLK